MPRRPEPAARFGCLGVGEEPPEAAYGAVLAEAVEEAQQQWQSPLFTIPSSALELPEGLFVPGLYQGYGPVAVIGQAGEPWEAAGGLPPSWLPSARVTGVNVHWTAGGSVPNSVDREHYHLLVDQAGRVSRGDAPIGRWVGHTRGLNTGRVGVSLCGMMDARAGGPHGPCPIRPAQWAAAARVVAEVVYRYGLKVTYRHVVQHGEVQAVFGIRQRGKWDCLELPWAPGLPPTQVCRDFRLRVLEHLGEL